MVVFIFIFISIDLFFIFFFFFSSRRRHTRSLCDWSSDVCSSDLCCAPPRKASMPEAMEKTIAILLLDDHALFRESLVRFLHAEPGLEVVAQCGSIEEALRVLERRQVDVVLLDLDLEIGRASCRER